MSIWFVMGLIIGALFGGLVLIFIITDDTWTSRLMKILFFYVLLFIIVGAAGSIITLGLLSLAGVS